MAGFYAGRVGQEAIFGMLVSFFLVYRAKNRANSHLLKRRNSWAVRKQNLGWIALSASAFKMGAIDAPEGYVLLTIPSARIGDGEHGSASHDAGTVGTPVPMEYTLWEMTGGHGRS